MLGAAATSAIFVLSLAASAPAQALEAQEPAVDAERGEPVSVEGLGSLHFPNFGAPAAQDDFRRGVLLLHSFEYRDAAAAFRRAQELDPDFALAYWGEAMTHNHPVWNDQAREAALEVLARYAPNSEERAARAPTPYERGWMQAVDALYGPGDTAARDMAYTRAMERLVEAHPEDFEARAFHALSLLGLSQGSRDHPTYMRAAALALALHDENPHHPGAAHYAIHAVDDPVHAPLGLRPARAYADIAPEAAHAQHMTSHIFLALGLWEEVVAANERAADVMNGERRERDLPPSRCGHFNEWLLYGYLQQGRLEDASALVRGCQEDVPHLAGADIEVDWSSKLRGGRGMPRPSAGEEAARSFARMRSLYLADPRAESGALGHTEAEAVRRPEEGVYDGPAASAANSSLVDLGTALAASRDGEGAVLRRSLEALSGRRVDDAPTLARYEPVWERTLRSLLLAEAGDLEAAVNEARRAAEHEAGLPVDYGPPIAAKPPRELEGELHHRMERADEALAAFELALQRTPRRKLSLLGYARAAAAAGRRELAADAYRTLIEILDSGDAGQEALEEARAFLQGREARRPVVGQGADGRRTRQSEGSAAPSLFQVS